MSRILENSEICVENNFLANDAKICSNVNTFEDNVDDMIIGDITKKLHKKRIMQFSDSDSEEDKENVTFKATPINDSHPTAASSESDDNNQLEHKSYQQRIRKISASSSDSKSEELLNTSRIKIKKNKLTSKFQNLKSRARQPEHENSIKTEEQHEYDSNEESYAVESIKQSIKKKISVSSICDPDTSDEETVESSIAKKKIKKTTKLTSPKPIRISAKQAMENMQKIKSESNRMLREKEVSLPYHRPKAISLKDIMSRRKPAVNSDGKALPIKMNNDQLRQFAFQLEQRQKEMMELCKSDTDEENEDVQSVNTENIPLDIDSKEIQTTGTKFNSDDAYNEVIAHTQNNLNNKNEDFDSKKNMNTSPSKDISKEDEKTDSGIVNNEKSCSEIIENHAVLLKSLNEESRSNMLIQEINNCNKDDESQLISLHYDSEVTEINSVPSNITDVIESSKTNPIEPNLENEQNNVGNELENLQDIENSIEKAVDKSFDDCDCDIEMDDIDKIIEDAEIIETNNKGLDVTNSSMLMMDQASLNINPRLTGVPGSVIDLDRDSQNSRKLTGVELLKERFVYFSNLKTPEEIEKAKEKRIKPGVLHLKLKHELEEQIEEQRCLEWEKRLEKEKELQDETARDELEDKIDELEDSGEKKLSLCEENAEKDIEKSEEEEEELIEDDVYITDKSNKKNPLIDDEAEVSEDEEDANENENDNSETSSEDEESDSEEENKDDHKKGRILKAFEDSDDEVEEEQAHNTSNIQGDVLNSDKNIVLSQISQDEDLQLAQRPVYSSEDLFTSQETELMKTKINASENKQEIDLEKDDGDAGTQTFSLLNTQFEKESTQDRSDVDLRIPDNLSINNNLAAVMPMCSGNFSQNFAPSQVSQTENKDMGDDILALCTGKFYDNEFISQSEDAANFMSNDLTQKTTLEEVNNSKMQDVEKSDKTKDCNILKEVLDELNDANFEQQNSKYFSPRTVKENNLQRKKLVIDSDDDTNKEVNDVKKKKKLKKKKLEDRALVFSDDEEDDASLGNYDEDELSDTEEDPNRIVEYDSEENEVVVVPEKVKIKKGKKMTEFFEQEAELTSEDEWIGSGDEDERGLDRMEREEGDEDIFNQNKLQLELGQIHMRDVLDTDKREVRIIQELLFEDGDLGDGHRQRKFRWRDGSADDLAAVPDELADTQEDDCESEEQWRKQRHEREVFLRQMQQDKTEDITNITWNRSSIIRGNISASSSSIKTVTSSDKTVETIVTNKNFKDIPSPKKGYTLIQRNYHGSLLTRGRGALARLAALATPIVADNDSKCRSIGTTSKGNFVFTTLTQDDEPKKAPKRKADALPGTPLLIKKLRVESKKNKKSLLDHL